MWLTTRRGSACLGDPGFRSSSRLQDFTRERRTVSRTHPETIWPVCSMLKARAAVPSRYETRPLRQRRRLMRIDRWLWTARLFKTRGLAAEAVKGGRVHVNGVAAKPSREVAPDDELQITIGPMRRTVIVRGLAERRVSAAEAATLYEETPESAAERERQRELRRLAGPLNLGGRPTKRDRRRYDARRR